MKIGYSLDETGNWRLHPEEATVVRLVFTRYVNDQKSMDVLAYNLPMEVSPRTLGGKIWQEHHIHTILSDSNYAGVEETQTGFAPGQYPPIIPIELFNPAQQRRCRLTNLNYRVKIRTI